MEVSVIINRLGPIYDSEIEFKPFIVLTGESGLGKSYTALLWYNLMNTLSLKGLADFLRNRLQGDWSKTLSFTMNDFRMWLNANASAKLGYLLGNNDFSCDVNYVFKGADSLSFKGEPIGKADDAEFVQYSVNGEVTNFPPGFNDYRMMVCYSLHTYLVNLVFGKRLLRSLIFPPARAAFMGGNMTSSVGMYRDFLEQLDWLKTPQRTQNADRQMYLNAISKMVDGRVVIENGSIYLELEGGNKIPVSAAASSVKELMPFMLFLQNGTEASSSILFEEPEAHVHPLKQHLVMDMLVRCCNKGMFVQMPTHSDYLLSRMNQLLRLGRIRKVSKDTFDDYCTQYQHNRQLFLNEEQVGAYYFMREGGHVKIVSQNIADGLPFTAFEQVVKRQMSSSGILDEIEENLGIASYV